MMNHLESISDAMCQLTERYGITLTELPERFSQKILELTGRNCSAEVQKILEPLKQGVIRPARIKTGEKIHLSSVNLMIEKTAQVEGYDNEQAKSVVNLWLRVFKVAVDNSNGSNDYVEPRTQLDDFRVTFLTDDAIEVVTNQFDNVDNNVVEPTIEDFDGNFSDTSFEIVAEQPVVNENNSSQGISYNSSQNNLDSSVGKARSYGKNVPPIDPGQMVPTTDSKYSLNDAFRELRDSNYEMASKIMMELARAGDSKAQFHLGEFYLGGTGVELNVDKAKYWFRKAAKKGSVPAKNKLLDLESGEEGGGCLSGCFTVFLVVIVLKFLSSLL